MLCNFSVWWETLIFFEKLCYVIAIPATIIFIMQVILSLIGGDVDAHGHDITSDHPDDGFHFFSIKNILAFLAIFGWCGIGFTRSNIGLGLTIFISIICGLLMMAILAGIFYLLNKLSDSGTLEISNAIGKVGEVYLTIPGQRNGVGKVQVKVQGALRTLDAMTDHHEEIRTGNFIEVIDVLNDQLLIVKTIDKKNEYTVYLGDENN